MEEINYVKGDATRPISGGPKVVIHICNDIGAWGKGFVLAISKRWSKPEKDYRNLSDNYHKKFDKPIELGLVQFVKVEDDIWVANMIAQHGIRRGIGGKPPIRYDALRICLEKVAKFAIEKNASIHCPRIGSGLAGGKWDEVSILIEKYLCSKDISIYIYDL